jgi:glycosyltransferase involved in cell wall biosynthesis
VRRKINQSTFTIIANGFADGPAQALRDYLIKHDAKRVITVAHPLVPEGSNVHIITEYKDGKISVKQTKLPHKPPYTYLFDPFVPLRLPKSSAWIGFNNLACLRGLQSRKIGRTDKVIYWAVDFVAERFGKSVATKGYDKVDRYVCKNADYRVELSPVGVTSRNKYHGLKNAEIAPTSVVPMGAWLDRTPKVPASAWKKHKIVYLGHLVERQGVDKLVEAVSILVKRGVSVTAEVVGSGPLEADLRQQAKDLKVDKLIKFQGFVKDHKDVETILASGTFAAAPYVKDDVNFVQFTDAGKLKAYLGAYLPIVLTDVPNNAQELKKAGVALISDDSAKAFADVLEKWLTNEGAWTKAHTAATKVAQEFDWNNLLKTALNNFGFEE